MMYLRTRTDKREQSSSELELELALCYSLFLASGSPLLVTDLMTGVGQVHLGIGVRQTVGDQLQL